MEAQDFDKGNLGGEGRRGRRETYIELAGETSKAGLSVNRREYMESKLLGTLNDDMLASSVPANHMMILRTLE